MSESNMIMELQRARHNLTTLGFKPMFPQISLEARQSLASVLSTDESIDHLTAAKRLHRPLADETPLWEEYPDLAEWLDEMAAEDKETENLRVQFQEECESRLREAIRDFERFLAGHDEEHGPPEEVNLRRRTLSKDDLQIGVATNGGSELRRRPSFMAETSQGRIQIDAMETTSAKTGPLPVTSTPHVPHTRLNKVPRISDIKADLFDAGNDAESSRPRAPSLTRIDYVRSKTFERIPAGTEPEIGVAQATFVADAENEHEHPAGKTLSKDPNATIVKSSSNSGEAQNTKRTGNVPRIAAGPSRPTIATRPSRETKLQKPSKFASKIQVLPSKATSGVPSRQLPTRKPGLPSKESGSASSISSASSSSRTASAITKPSKPLRPALRK